MNHVSDSVKVETKLKEDQLYRVKAGAFLTSIAGFSAIFGFGATLAIARRKDPVFFSKGVAITTEMADSGALLALRALGWGSLYAIGGTSLFCYGIYKLSGAENLKDFGRRMGQILPKISRNNPPQSRTEFTGLNDLLTYLATDYGKSKEETKPLDR